MSGTHSMICMLCDTRITCRWEVDIDAVALAAGWVELPKNERRRSPHHACAACVAELAARRGQR